MHLKDPFEISSMGGSINIIQLNDKFSNDDMFGKSVVVSGFGDTTCGRQRSSSFDSTFPYTHIQLNKTKHLLKVKLTVWDNTRRCTPLFGRSNLSSTVFTSDQNLFENMIALDEKDEKAACKGDSGGTILCKI